MRAWDALTNLGDASITLPLVALAILWLAATHRWRVALWWSALCAVAALIVGVTKFAYAGWNIAFTAMDFTVVSGHTMLSSAVYPLIFYLAAYPMGQRGARWAFAGGFALAILIGISRVVVGAHSPSEVIAGWLLGLAVNIALIPVLVTRRAAPPKPAAIPFLAASLTIAVLCYGHVAPIQGWIIDTAPRLSHMLSSRF